MRDQKIQNFWQLDAVLGDGIHLKFHLLHHVDCKTALIFEISTQQYNQDLRFMKILAPTFPNILYIA